MCTVFDYYYLHGISFQVIDYLVEFWVHIKASLTVRYIG